MSGIKTFWLEPTDEVAVGLRRYARPEDTKGWDCAGGYHHTLVYTGREPANLDDRGILGVREEASHDDERWPTRCAQGCGYEFAEGDHWQMWQERLYRRTDTGELRVLHSSAPAPDAPSAEAGACWDAAWMPFGKGPDGIFLMVRLPPDGHDWTVDGRASNCTKPDDKVHKCWVRHGDPRECKVTVDKNGVTCEAGAGSIGTPNWHGFLREGMLVT